MNGRHAIPLIRLYDNLIVPIQTELSDELMARLTEDVTGAIERSPIAGLIIDLTGLDVMDSYVTRCIRDLALTTRVMGVNTIVCGMRWAMVITLVEMGLSIPGVHTALNLESALSMLAPSELEEGQPDVEQANEAQEIADADAPLRIDLRGADPTHSSYPCAPRPLAGRSEVEWGCPVRGEAVQDTAPSSAGFALTSRRT